MKLIKKPVIIFISLLVAAVLTLVFFKKYLTVKPAPGKLNLIKPHFYKNPAIDLSKISLKVFYVVPANSQVAPEWRGEIDSVLAEQIKFHSSQFHNTSLLSPEVYPEPVMLERENIFYDTENTNYGNPEGLRNIVPELERRFGPFLRVPVDAYMAIAIVYEGVGASGAPNAMMLSRTYLSKDDYRLSRSSLFYHEFAHTYGLPDRFDLNTNEPFSGDIMGSGRYKPLETNYFGSDLQEDLGLILFK